MDRPLWQIVLALLVASFGVHRGAAAAMLYLGEGHPALLWGYTVQTLAAMATALGLWLGRAWVVGALLILGIAVTGTALFAGFFLGAGAVLVAVSQALVVAVATGALALVMHREIGVRERRSRE